MSFQPPIIHVGYQKTGSTFLQQEIFSNSDAFFTPWGEQSARAIEHFLLAHPARFDAEQVRAEFKGAGTRMPVISHEDLLGYPILGRYYPELALSRMAKAFPDAKILICMREQGSMLLSQYFQYIIQGGRLTLKEMLTNNLGRDGFRPLMRLDHFEYDLMHATACRYFPSEQVLLLPFELLREDRELFVGSILNFCGLEMDVPVPNRVVRKRRGAAALRVERFLNGLLPDPPIFPEEYKDYPLRVRARNRFVSLTDEVATKLGVGGGYTTTLQAEINAHVGTYFHQSNARTAEIVGYDIASLGYKLPG